MKKPFYFAVFFLLGILNSSAEDCAPITEVRWLLKEVEETHPQLLFKRLQLDQQQAKEFDARKIINPELEHFSVWGKEFEPKKVYMNETRLWFTLQLANKRRGRIDEWEKNLSLQKYEEILLKQALLKDLWLNFFRLHQIHEEIKIKSKVISKLEVILSQFEKRKALSPDQSIEKQIIKMVVDNFELSGSFLKKEELSIFEFLKEVTGYQCQIKKISAQEDTIKWPRLNKIEELKEKEMILSTLANFELNLIKSSNLLAEKKAIPDIKMAPVFQNYQSGDQNVYTAGVSFVFPLAIFDKNQSERLSTTYQKAWAEKKLELSRTKENQRLKFSTEKYMSGLGVLREVEVIETSLSKFESVETWFKQGKISISNVVEFCRQLDEIMKNYHHGESLLMNDLLEIYELKGIINTDNLTKLI
jgi:hypothetical protein